MSQGQGQNRGGFKPKWHFAKEFYDETTGVAVVVNKSNQRVPRYSLKTGRYGGQDGQLLPYIGAQVTQENIFSGTLEDDNINSLLKLIAEARDWVKEDLKNSCEEAQATAEAAERAAANRDKPVTRHTGKTDKKHGRISTETEQAPSEQQAAAA